MMNLYNRALLQTLKSYFLKIFKGKNSYIYIFFFSLTSVKKTDGEKYTKIITVVISERQHNRIIFIYVYIIFCSFQIF